MKTIIKEEEQPFGAVIIHIEGIGFIKEAVVSKIRKSLNDLIGERHLFIDGIEVNPYTQTK